MIKNSIFLGDGHWSTVYVRLGEWYKVASTCTNIFMCSGKTIFTFHYFQRLSAALSLQNCEDYGRIQTKGLFEPSYSQLQSSTLANLQSFILSVIFTIETVFQFFGYWVLGSWFFLDFEYNQIKRNVSLKFGGVTDQTNKQADRQTWKGHIKS